MPKEKDAKNRKKYDFIFQINMCRMNGVSLKRNKEIDDGLCADKDAKMMPVARVCFQMKHSDIYSRLIPQHNEHQVSSHFKSETDTQLKRYREKTSNVTPESEQPAHKS